MNAKTKCLAAGLLVAALAGAWWGRAASRAHQKIVTLRVRNAPLADVVKSLERQTRETIRFDKRLGAKVTLNLVDASLAQALDALAAKAGARWQIVDAVGASGLAWRQLELALASGGDVSGAGWTNLAPQFDEPPPMLADGGGDGADHPGLPPGPGPRHVFRTVGPGGGGERMVTMDGDGKIDQWSSERLILEARLAGQLGAAIPLEATSEAALQTAAAVHGEARRYYALEKAPFGMGFGGGMRMSRHLEGPPGGPGGPPRDIGAAIVAEQRQRRLQELANSPEAQVEQARQRAASGGQARMLNFDVK